MQTVESQTAGGNDVVLVVEDEQSVRTFCCTILRRSGYRVLEASGPLEALDTLKQSERISLVLRLIDRGQQPDFRVLYMSGYDDSVGLGIDLLQKPFTSADLLQRVRDALGRSQHTTTA
jgi:CheY-like chemotaxis protein